MAARSRKRIIAVADTESPASGAWYNKSMNRRGFAPILILIIVMGALVAGWVWYQFFSGQASSQNNAGYFQNISTSTVDFTLVNLDNEYTVEIPKSYMYNSVLPHTSSTPNFYFEENWATDNAVYFTVRIDPYSISSNPLPITSTANDHCSISGDAQTVYCEGLALTDSSTTTNGTKFFYAEHTQPMHTSGGYGFMGPTQPESWDYYTYVFAVPDQADNHIVEFLVNQSNAPNFQGIAGVLKTVSVPSLQPMTGATWQQAAVAPPIPDYTLETDAKSNPAFLAEESPIYKSFDTKLMPDGTMLAKYGPVVWAYSNDSGQCGACPHISMKIIALDKNNATSVAFQWDRTVDPGSSDYDIRFFDEYWTMIQTWDAPSYVDTGQHTIPAALTIWEYSSSTRTYVVTGNQTDTIDINPYLPWVDTRNPSVIIPPPSK